MTIGNGATDAEATIRALWYALDARDWTGVRALLHDEFVAELPVSGERFVGPDVFVRMNREYPGGWALTVIRVVAAGERAASEVRSRRAGKTEAAISFYELRDGKIAWEADWWPEPYPAPAARAALASPPDPPDPRLAWLDELDDARCSLLEYLEALPEEALHRPLAGIGRRPIDVFDDLSARDVAALRRVRALAPGVATGRSVCSRDMTWEVEATARLYRARADLRLALWQTPVEVWTRETVPASNCEPTSVSAIVRSIATHERTLAEQLASAGGPAGA